MRERRNYRGEVNQGQENRAGYPAGPSGTTQGPYGEAYPSYDHRISSMANPQPSEYHHAPQQQHSAPSSTYASSQRSRSSSAEGAPVPVPIQTFVLPGSAPYNPPAVSPTSVFHPHDRQMPPPPGSQYASPQIPSLTSSFFSGPTPAPVNTIYRDRFSLPQPPQTNQPSTFDSPQHQHRSVSAQYPGGLVGGLDGWNDQPLLSPVDAYPPADYPTAAPTPVLTSAPLSRQSSAQKGGKGAAGAAGKTAVSKASVVAPRKRVPASCKPCRAKKLRCSRSLPCSSCVERGDPEGCVWEGDATPLYTLRDDNDTKDLKAQVDRLQHLLDALTERTPPLQGEPASRPRLAHRHSNPGEPSADESRAGSEDDEPEATFDLHAIGLCEALSELALNDVMPPQQSGGESFAPGGGSGEVFVDEARQFLLSFTQRLGMSKDLPFTVLTPSSSEPSPSGSYDSPDVHMPSSDHLSVASSPSRISSPSALGLSAALLNVRPSQSHLLDLLPPIEEIEKTYTFYSQYVHWYSSPLDLGTIQRQWPAFRAALIEEDPVRREAAIDPLLVATVLAACASGLASMTNKQARSRGFPEDRSVFVERWTQASVLGLVVGRFLEEPSMEGVVAATVLGSLYVEQFMTTGETISAGMSLISLAVHAAFALNLHRDPAPKGKSEYSFAECEQRRRLFWSLFTICMSITTGTSRTWSQFDLRQIDCKFPLDCFDAELAMDERAAKARIRGRLRGSDFEETPMTASVVRAQYSLLVKKITDAAFSVKPCKYSEILALDGELRAFEKSFPAIYTLPMDPSGRVRFAVPPTLTEMKCSLIQLCICAEYVRLHRPFLVLAANDEQYQHSREQCVKYAKRMLAINATPGCKLNWAGHNFKVLSAAVVLGIELLQSPNEPDADSIRAMVDAALAQAEGFANVSSVCRKGSGVVRFLLNKVDEEAATTTLPRQAKRARTTVYNPEDVKPNRRSLSDALGGFNSNLAHRTDSDSSRRRKPIRPTLLHTNSTPVATQHGTFRTKDHEMERQGSRSHSLDDAFPTLATLQAQQERGGKISDSVSLSLHPTAPTLTYTSASQDRPVAGLPGWNGQRRTRVDNGSVSSSASASSAYGSQPNRPRSTHSSPDFAPAIPLPPVAQQSANTSLNLPDSFMSFSDMTASGQQPPLSSSSLFDEKELTSFFNLPASLKEGGEDSSHMLTPTLGGSSGTVQQQQEHEQRMGGGRSRFNEPLGEQEFRF